MKTKIVEVMRQTNAGIGGNMDDWKGQEIMEFQDDLQRKVNAYFSEKWFYNHFKTYNDRLPRIDLLNILSRYTGYIDWSEFKFKNKDNITLIADQKGSNIIFYLLPAIALVIIILTWALIKTGSMASYQFCFMDRDTREPIRNTAIEINVLPVDESPIYQTCSPDGCFTYKTGEHKITFVVKAPYYFTDTIKRMLKKSKKKEEIFLKINDYALMIDFFSHSKVKDWTKRREQLDNVIADSAYICQVFNNGLLGMELYNKTEFIDLLTIPTSSLQHIKIIEMLYTREKITTIRFIQDINTQ
jgi:hypothetical protein